MGGFPGLGDVLKKLKTHRYDDSVDRLHYLVTTYFLLFVAILITGYEYGGTPVLCWVPAEFKDTWKQFVDSYCFVQNTYNIPYRSHPKERDGLHKDHLPEEMKISKAIGYYQWVPMVMACQALLFYLPNFIWLHFNWQSGLNISGIMDSAATAELETEGRHKRLRSVSDYIFDSLALQRNKKSLKWCHWGNRWGSFVTILYLFVKLLYLGNAIGQLYMINSFLGFRHQWWGFQMLSDLASGRDWLQSDVFPRVTVCDYYELTTRGPQRYTSQCVLKINLFNEKIFLLLWFWFGLLAIFSVANLIYWLAASVPYCGRFNFVYDNLAAGGAVRKSERRGAKLHLFVTRLLGPDGILIVRFVHSHLGDLTATELLCHLWARFERDGGQLMQQEPNNNIADTLPMTNPKIHPARDFNDRSDDSENSGLKSNRTDLEMATWKVPILP